MGSCCGKLVSGVPLSARGKKSIESINPYIKKVKNESDFEQFLAEATEADKVVLADFYAPWCGPCQQISPKVDEMATEFKEKLTVIQINVDNNDELAMSYQIASMPTFVFFVKGKKVDELTGANPGKLRQLIVQYTTGEEPKTDDDNKDDDNKDDDKKDDDKKVDATATAAEAEPEVTTPTPAPGPEEAKEESKPEAEAEKSTNEKPND